MAASAAFLKITGNKTYPCNTTLLPFLVGLFCLLCTLPAFAQNPQQPAITISGSVTDSAHNQPVGFVTVVLQNPQTHASVKSGLTKDDGGFSFKAPAGKPYQLVLVFVGYN